MAIRINKKAYKLLLEFFVIGLFTFGGGWSIIAQLHKQYVEERKILSSEELTDITSVGRSLPGIMILNVSMLFGYKMAGLAGGLACLAGISAPPFLIILAVTFLYERLSASPVMAAAMTGVRAAVVPIIAYAAAKMLKSSLRNLPCVLVAAFSFVLYYFFRFSCIAVVLFGGVCGWLMTLYYTARRS